MEKLKNCPFCGCDKPRIKRTVTNSLYIQCRNGSCLAKTADWLNAESAIHAWNQRTVEEGDTNGNQKMP